MHCSDGHTPGHTAAFSPLIISILGQDARNYQTKWGHYLLAPCWRALGYIWPRQASCGGAGPPIPSWR